MIKLLVQQDHVIVGMGKVWSLQLATLAWMLMGYDFVYIVYIIA